MINQKREQEAGDEEERQKSAQTFIKWLAAAPAAANTANFNLTPLAVDIMANVVEETLAFPDGATYRGAETSFICWERVWLISIFFFSWFFLSPGQVLRSDNAPQPHGWGKMTTNDGFEMRCSSPILFKRRSV